MKTTKTELLSILNKLKPGLAKKDLVEQMTHYIFDGETIRTYNDHICIQIPFKTNFKCSVRANSLLKLIDKIKSEDIILKVKDNEFLLTTKKGTQKAGFTLIEDDSEVQELIDNLESALKENKWKAIPEGFIEGVSLCMFSTSNNESDGTLTCLYAKKNSIVSTDRYRISRFKMKGRIKKLFLKSSSAMELIRIPGITKYCIEQGWVCFKTDDDLIFSCRIYEGDYPDAESIIDQGIEGVTVTLPDELQEALDTVSILIDEDDLLRKYVKITLSKGKIICSRQKQRGWITETIKADIDIEEEVSIIINPLFLNQILNKVKEVTISKTKALFKTEDFEHLLMLTEEEEEK